MSNKDKIAGQLLNIFNDQQLDKISFALVIHTYYQI